MLLLQLFACIASMQSAPVQKASGKRLWNKEEDDLLRKIVSQLGENMQWAVISQKFNERMMEMGRAVKRTNKQCRERWQNHLNPALSNNAEWSLEEHHMLFTLLRQHSQQWSQISAKLRESGFGCRSDNHIKNYFYSSIKKAIKRINEILRNRNRLIKKQKSIMLNYNEKYAYQRHLSLQRQVQISSQIQSKSPTNVNNFIQNEDRTGQLADLKIIKELDQEIVRKILLIAQSKGAKKFTISYKKYQEDAITTRDRLIDFIQNDSAFKDEDIISLASQILELSKKCKRKSRKNQSLDDEMCYQEQQCREVHHGNQGSEEFKKNASGSIDQNQKLSAQFKMQTILDDRLLCQQHIITGRYKSRKSQQSNPTNQRNTKEEMLERVENISKNIFLDQSNPYLFGSDCYYINEDNPQENQMANNDPLPSQTGQIHNLLDLSQNLLECNQPYELPLELFKTQNVIKLRAGSAEFEFLSSIRQLNPSKLVHEHEQLFNFDINDEGMNPFFDCLHSTNIVPCQRRKIFSQQLEAVQIPHADPCLNKMDSHQEKHMEEKNNSAKSILNRSWAYSSNLLELQRIADLSGVDCIIMRNRLSAPS